MNEKGQRIIALRKKEKTHSEIAKILNIPKSTVGWWLKGVEIPKAIQKKILEKSRKIWRKNIQTYNKYYGKIRSEEAAKIREEYKQKASKEIKKILSKDLKFIGIALYWAEGGTKNRNSLWFSNSDPSIIKTMMKFFREVCKVHDKKIKAKIHLYPQISPKKATRYWSSITGLSSAQFTKPQIQISKASKKRRGSNTLPHGTLHLGIHNTELTCKVKGWIRGISEKI